MEYIPYSTRHNIKDPDLAWLLDYLEREMGWEISIFENKVYSPYRLEIRDKENTHNCIHLLLSSMVDGKYAWATIFFIHWILIKEIHSRLFYRTYRTLLPVILDLYSK